MTKKEQILRVLAAGLRPMFGTWPADLGQLEEIRLRIGQPLAVTWSSCSLFVAEDGRFCQAAQAHRVTAAEVRETMNYLSSYSRYAFEDKIRQGFLTIQGGHRVGLAGRVVLESDSAAVKTIAPITALNLRIARQVPGCGTAVFPWLGQQDVLIASPPGWGKTTLLRDLIRLLSESGTTVGVVDERSELAACYQGIPQNDLGPRTDVLDGCPKAEGMMMLVRTMSPQVIAVDEIGGREDCQAVEYAMNCGCRILATVHGSGWEELEQRPVFGQWLGEGRFGRYVFLEKTETDGGPLYGYRICDRKGQTLWTGQGEKERR